jgi:subtilisin family serine protease
MPRQVNRRDVLKAIGAGTVTLSAVGPVTAADDTRYIITTRGRGVRRSVEAAGFEVTRELGDGDVLLVRGTGTRTELEAINGVKAAAQDQQFTWNGLGTGATSNSFTAEGNPPPADEDLTDRQWDHAVMDVQKAHETATGKGTSVAIIDNGIDADHPALPNVDTEAGRLFKYGTVQSGSGDVALPADPTDLCEGTRTRKGHVTDDTSFHGTWVAGIAGANRTDGGETGMVGTAPDTTLVPLKVLWWDEFDYDCDGDGTLEEGAAAVGTTTGDILAAIDYAASIGVDAMNLSLGTGPLPPQANRSGIRTAYERVVAHATRQGSVVAVAAGNSSANLQQGGFFSMPGGAAGSIDVSATGPNDRPTFYTTYGTNAIDVGAPGGGYDTFEKTFCTGDGEIFVPAVAPFEGCDSDSENCDCTPPEYPYPYNGVVSTIPGDSWLGQLLGGARYYQSGGTSGAAPHVAATAALVREVAPDATARQVEQAIEQGAELVTGKNDAKLGAGRVNCSKALEAPSIR